MKILYEKKEEELKQIPFINGKISGTLNFSKLDENKVVLVIDDRFSIRNISKKSDKYINVGIVGKENEYDRRATPIVLNVQFYRACIYGENVCEIYLFVDSEKKIDMYLDFVYPEEVGSLDIIKRNIKEFKYL